MPKLQVDLFCTADGRQAKSRTDQTTVGVIGIIAIQHGPGTLSRVMLERMCRLSAERLSMIYGLHSPDFFNQTLFHDFIRKLQEQEVLRKNGDGLLDFDADVVGIGADARLVLGEEIRHSILSLTMPGEQLEV